MSSKSKPHQQDGAKQAESQAAGKPAASSHAKPKDQPLEIVELEIPLKRLSSSESVKKALSTLSFITDLNDHSDAVVASVVETRDIHKNPYLYYEFTFKPSGLALKYSITPEVNARQRRVDICRNLLGMLALTGESYGVKLGPLYTLLQNSLEDSSANANQTYQQLLNRHEALMKENKSMVERHKKLKEVNDELNNSFLELEKRSQMIGDRLKQLEGMTDIELKEELQRWIFEHDGSIRYSDFAKTFNIPQSRVEDGINMLLKEGYIVRSD